MPDEENIGGGVNEDAGEGGQEAALSGEEHGAADGTETHGVADDGEQGRGQSNVGEWDPAQQGGGGGELY